MGFSNQLALLRHEKGCSQRQAAADLGISPFSATMKRDSESQGSNLSSSAAIITAYPPTLSSAAPMSAATVRASPFYARKYTLFPLWRTSYS